MSNKFQDKYRISSARLQKWDYSWNAVYFVTINTHGQEEFFGNIENGEMYLSNTGTIADVLWYEIKNHFEVVDLDVFIVMPNHVHMILVINNPENKSGIKETGLALSIQQKGEVTSDKVFSDAVKTRHALSLSDREHDENKSPGQKRQRNQGKNSLSSIIGSYKSAVSKHAHRLGYRFDWQSRFHDRIIRDEESLHKARKYIENNISNWENDPFNKLGSYDNRK